jgi:hypothetical protein|nr:MAG TPA: Baseplate component [Caudoviricetes sp.]
MSEENVSLPVAQALASALEKIEAYVPTEYVDNSEPDIDAEHLNHAEQGIMRVTNLLNAAVDVIQGQESRLSDAETKVGTKALTGGMTDLSSGVNSLYSDLKNMWSLSGNQTLIPNNSDMHTYLTPGNYYCASNTNAETLKNSPLKFAFTMKVYLSVGIGSQYLIQEYTKYDASERILVYYDGNRNIWTSYHVQLEKMV